MRALLVLTALLLLAALPATASAATCRFSDVDAFPAVHGGQAYGISCSTARAVGNKIQRGYARTGQMPRRVKANGMRFRCGYRFYVEDGAQLVRATCRRTSRPEQRAVLKLSA